MQELDHRSIKKTQLTPYASSDGTLEHSPTLKNKESKHGSKIVKVTKSSAIENNEDLCAINSLEVSIIEGTSNFSQQNNLEISTATYQSPPQLSVTVDLFRLFVKNGEYVYARADDIIMIESCDHLVKVFLGIEGKVKLTLRHNTLKDFLSQLPQTQFKRLGRFCAVNVHRLSGGNCNEQTFEFDFKISIKLKHSVSHTIFGTIGK